MSRGPRIVVVDLETREGPEIPGGWDALRRGEGGISALAVWDSHEDWVSLYDDTCIDDAVAHIEAADILAGFATSLFDVPVIEGRIDRRLRLPEHFDILAAIWTALQIRDFTESQRGYKLNDLAMRCIGRNKLEHGAHAPQLAREGQWARLFRYCLDDVRITRDLLQYILREGGVIDANGQFLRLPGIPQALQSLALKDCCS